jgi:hypothetical protein
VLRIPDCDYGVNLFNQLLLLVIIKVHVPFGQPGLSGPVLDQDEANLKRGTV